MIFIFNKYHPAALIIIHFYTTSIFCVDHFQNTENFRNYVFVHDCNKDEKFETDLESNSWPRMIVHCPPYWWFYDRIPTESPQLPRYGANRYTHVFYKIIDSQILGYWSDMYSRLTFTQQKLDFFEYSSKNYYKYPNFEPWAFRVDYYHSQWNQDMFDIRDSRSRYLIMRHITEGSNSQVPKFFQRKETRRQDIQRIEVLMYSTLSGWAGNRCRFYSRYEQLYYLTEQYNAFDVLFCDVFNYYNITPIKDYNFKEVRWTRNFFFRDDLTISFPPEVNAVFYESPGITYIMLREQPLLWNNIVRPFKFDVWMLIISSLVVISICSKCFSMRDESNSDLMFKRSWYYYFNTYVRFLTGGTSVQPNTSESRVTSARCWGISVHIFRLILTSAYSGMILGGILDQSYPWSPNTFAELNTTTNVVLATSHSSAVGIDLLTNESYLLNGAKGLVIDREDPVKSEDFLGAYLKHDEVDLKNRYALFMYDDKKYHWIYSKQQLYLTHQYLDKLEMNKEVVRRVMRYISVPPGATKLHFIIDGIRNCFESGSWMRWRYLEQNYFKYVAPIVSKAFYGVKEADKNRALHVKDLWSTGLVWACGLGGCLVIFVLEAYKRIAWELLAAVANFFAGFSYCCLHCGFGLLKVKKWITTLNQFD